MTTDEDRYAVFWQHPIRWLIAGHLIVGFLGFLLGWIVGAGAS